MLALIEIEFRVQILVRFRQLLNHVPLPVYDTVYLLIECHHLLFMVGDYLFVLLKETEHVEESTPILGHCFFRLGASDKLLGIGAEPLYRHRIPHEALRARQSLESCVVLGHIHHSPPRLRRCPPGAPGPAIPALRPPRGPWRRPPRPAAPQRPASRSPRTGRS